MPATAYQLILSSKLMISKGEEPLALTEVVEEGRTSVWRLQGPSG